MQHEKDFRILWVFLELSRQESFLSALLSYFHFFQFQFRHDKVKLHFLQKMLSQEKYDVWNGGRSFFLKSTDMWVIKVCEKSASEMMAVGHGWREDFLINLFLLIKNQATGVHTMRYTTSPKKLCLVKKGDKDDDRRDIILNSTSSVSLCFFLHPAFYSNKKNGMGQIIFSFFVASALFPTYVGPGGSFIMINKKHQKATTKQSL